MNAGVPRSTAAPSPPSASSAPKPTPGSSTTTIIDATTATSCEAAHPPKSSASTRPDDTSPQATAVTSNPGREDLVRSLVVPAPNWAASGSLQRSHDLAPALGIGLVRRVEGDATDDVAVPLRQL